jgi:hypothetical protein
MENRNAGTSTPRIAVQMTVEQAWSKVGYREEKREFSVKEHETEHHN